ncbi:MAG: apolipoprotein N-acyltransferase [Pseudomonadota bacterium]
MPSSLLKRFKRFTITNPQEKISWQSRIIALGLGGLYPLGFAPFNIWPLTIVSLIGWCLIMIDIHPRAGFRKGWWYGFGVFGVGVCWVFVSIHNYGGASIPLATTITTICAAGLGIFFAFTGYFWAKIAVSYAPLLSGAALWVLSEWCRSWAFSGFPWLYTGYAFIDTPLRGFAPLGGVLLVSFVAIITAQGIALCLYLEGHQILSKLNWARVRPTFLFLIGLWAGGWALSLVEWTSIQKNEPIRAQLVQGNIEQSMKWDASERQKIIETYLDLTRNYFNKPHTSTANAEANGRALNDASIKTLIVWPESALPMYLEDAEPSFVQILNYLKGKNADLIAGQMFNEELSTAESDPSVFNSLLAWPADSAFSDRQVYKKQQLVPFGEYIPLSNSLGTVLPFLKEFAKFSLKEGDRFQNPFDLGTYSVAPSICYEIAFPETVRKMSLSAEILVTVSNDAWFGNSHGPAQHFEMVRMRSLELGRYTLRATNTGITGIIDPQGYVVNQLPTFKAGVLIEEVYPVVGQTPYGRFGALPLLLICGAIILLVGIIHWFVHYLQRASTKNMTAAELIKAKQKNPSKNAHRR